MSWSYPIGRLFGSELRVHATFVLLLLWVGVSAWLAEGPAAALWNVAFVLALFACVVAHEFGHALMARRFGIATPDVTLLPIGGVARLEKMPDDPRQEIWIAVAGPAVNVVIWAVLVVVFGAPAGLTGFEELDRAGSQFIASLASVNLLLLLFNMVPAFPMDGGRVFRAALEILAGREKATSIAAIVGQSIAVLFGLLGILSGNIILVLIAFFVFAAAAAERSDTQLRSVSEGIRARDAMITSYEALGPDDGLMAMSAGLLRTTQHEFPVLDTEGRVLGFVTRDAIFRAAEGDGGRHVRDVMTPDVPTVLLDAPLSEVLDLLAQPGRPAVAVTDRNGVFIGYITRENIGELVVLRRSRGLI